MDELTAKPQWIDDVEEAFSQIKNAGNAERAEWYEVIREDHGAIAERELKARVAAHDERVKPRPTPAPPSASAQVISLLNRSPRDFQAPVEAKPKPNVVARPTGGIRRLAGEKPQGISLPKPDQRIAPPEPEPAQGATEPEPRVMLPAVVPSTLPRPAPNWDEAIEAMNRQHAIIDNVGNKTVIASWEPTPLDPTRKAVVFQTKDSFLLRYSNRYAIIDVADGRGGGRQVSIPLGQWWLAHRQRQQYRGVTFMPNAAREINDCLNLWQGWGVDPKSGDWSLIQAHIEDIVAAGNEDYAEYVIRWLAWTIQNPDAPPEVALVLIGHKGAGKGTLARVMQRIFGAHAFQVTTQEHLIGKFNGHLQDCVVLIADEAYWEDTKKCIGRLQGMITEPTLAIERKGLDVFEVRNFLHVMMLAEPGWVIPAGRHERRYAVLGVSEARLEDKPYFRALHDQINNGGAEAMFYDLQRMDLGDWHPRDIPKSLLTNPAMQKQQGLTLPPLEQWYVMLLHNAKLPGALATRANTTFTQSLLEDARDKVPRLRDLTEVALRNFLLDADSIGTTCTKYRSSQRNGWTFPPLSEAREAWSRRYGPTQWDTPAEDWSKPLSVEGNVECGG